MRLCSALCLFSLLVGIAAAPALARAASPGDAAGFIDQMLGDAVASLQNAALSDADREQHIIGILQQDFDLSLISRFVLGRHWASASDDERQTFATLFPQWVIKIYSPRLRQLCDQQIKVLGAHPGGGADAIVSSQIVDSHGSPVRIDWRVGIEGSGFKIIDIAVEGVSMLLTQRDEVAAAIDRTGGTVASLNAILDKKLHGDATDVPSSF